jgi:predicted MPP superfamily phosphohydrolase
LSAAAGRPVNRSAIVLLVAAIAGALLVVHSLRLARAMPEIHRATVSLSGWPRGQPPIRVALLSDIHIGNGAMDAGRLGRILDRVTLLRPDLVLIAGDFIAGADPGAGAAAAPALTAAFARLRPRLGTVAVLGNHDLWTGPSAIRGALERAGVTVLQNQAVARGPVAIAGLADVFTDQQNVAATWSALRTLPGARIVLTHSPDGAERLPADAQLVLAGHTHCGQVVLPLIGAVDPVALLRFACGAYRVAGRMIIVSGGLGASALPVRFGAPPDLWLLLLGPPAVSARGLL